MKTLQTFEDYLGKQHADQYAGTDDNMQDDYEAWLENLDNEELIKFGNELIEFANHPPFINAR